tara:strand:- start:223 stop:1467 length:1245 start_codon:yes stop_codon:yes gene_type:complete
MSSDLAIFGGKPIREKSFPSWPKVTDEIKQGLIDTLENDDWGIGSGTIDRFNKKFSEIHEAKYCLALHSGTSAIWVSLKAIGVQAGDEVIIPSYTFIATASAVILANAIPVFADINIENGNIDPSSIESLITKKTKAIIPVHTGGSPADMGSILNISKKYNIPVIEDAAQAHGAVWHGNKVGALGMGGIFSFQTSKNMSSGEGGAIISNDESFMDACYSYHNCGRVRDGKWYEHHRLGSNLRMSAFNAAVLIPQIDSLNDGFHLREQNRRKIDSAISQMKGLLPMRNIKDTKSSNHIYICRYIDSEFSGIRRSVFFKAMQAEGVFTYKGWSALYKEPLFTINPKEYPWLEGINYNDVKHINTENFSEREAVWLKQNHLIGSQEDTQDVIDAFEKVVTAMQKDPKLFLDLDLDKE